MKIQLRENPLFTRAKQHLELEPGSNGRRSGRRLNGSITIDSTSNETVSYVRLDNCTKPSVKELSTPKELETIIMLPNELDAIIGKRTKSTNDINQIKSRPSIKKSPNQIQTRKSELELIFQVMKNYHFFIFITNYLLLFFFSAYRNVHNEANKICHDVFPLYVRL